MAIGLVLVTGCRRVGDSADLSKGPHARGTIVLSVLAGTDQATLDAQVATEVQLLTHRATLGRALVRLGLAEGAGDEMKLGFEQHISARRIEDSLLIEVVVQDEDPNRAARLCNALLEARLSARLEAKHSAAQGRLAWLDGQVAKLEERLKQLPMDEAAAHSRLQAELAKLLQRRTELNLEARLAGPGMRILEPCRPSRPPKS